ncbi:NfeD family protein [Tamaricihabitans halophyticus]|nr:NfeD family protein [Tamaricihabitans halophyticus]
MSLWLFWLILAFVLGTAEIFTYTAALGLLGGAALLTSGFAAVGVALPVQLLLFTIISITSVVLVRPIALRHMLRPQEIRFGIDALVGKSAYVLQDVSARDGRVRIGDEEWIARAYDETLVIPAGETVDVMEIKGNAALVYPRE